MYKTEIVKRIGGFNPRFVPAEDIDLCLRLAEQGAIACINKPLVKIRKHSNNISLMEVGRTSLLHALAAIICSFARSKDMPDPSACRMDADWQVFVEWIAFRTEQHGLFERNQKWAQLRQDYLSSGSRLICAWRLMKGLVSSRHTLQFLHDKFVCSDFAATLAGEWMKKQCMASSA